MPGPRPGLLSFLAFRAAGPAPYAERPCPPPILATRRPPCAGARTSPWCWSATTGPAGCRRCSRGWPASWRRSRTRSRVDTGSKDGSAELLADAFGADCVVAVPPSTSFPAALRAGLAHLDELGADTEWIWVLHDDASPHPEALLALLAGAADDPGADVLGPMLREWPSLKRLLEFGVTISATGRRETGLEGGEYDQGQYSEPRTRPGRQHRGDAGPAPRPRRARRPRRRSCRSSATTSTSAGGPPRPGTGPWWCRRRWCSTPRPPTAGCGVRR